MRLKKLLSVIVSICIMFSFLIPAKAASLTTADKGAVLGKLTIFSSKDLTAQAKRFEAAVYAVRILGKEKLVKEGEYKNTKFTDVDSSLWYAPYVGYCDEIGLITDAQGGKFQPEQYISEKAFLSLILGTLGYTYNKDFTLSTVYKKAYEVGIVTDASYKTRVADNTKYKKSDIVNVLYNALGKEQKGTKVKLIQNLVHENVITKEDAISTGILTDKTVTAITGITVLDQNNIMIKINEPVQSLTPDNIKMYTGSPDKTLAFTIKSQANDGTIILNTATHGTLESYIVELSNVKDIEGNESGVLTGSFEGMQGAEVKSDFFRISKVVPVSKDCINVYFTHPVNINSLIASCYEIYDGDKLFVKGSSQTLSVQTINGVENGVSIYLKGTVLTKDTLYLLKINGSLISAYGVKLGDGSGDSIKFKGVENSANSSSNSNNSASDLSLTNISLVDNQTMRLEFNMEITPTLAKQIINYYIADTAGTQVTVKKAVLTSESGKNNRIVIVTINGTFTAGASYSLAIDYLTDVTRQYAIDGKQYSFVATFPSKVNLLINSVSSIDGNTIKITFNKGLDQEAAENVSNYVVAGISHVGYSVVPVKAIYDPAMDPYSVKLYLPYATPVLQDKVYMISALSTLKDNLGNLTGSKISNVLTCSNGTVTTPSIKEAVTISSDTIRVDFNKEILLNNPAIFTSNYILQYISGGEVIRKMPVGICIISKTRVILKFDSLDNDTTYKLGFGTIQDYSGNSNSIDAGAQNSITVKPGK